MRANRFQATIGPPPGVIDARFGSVIASRFGRGGVVRPLAATLQRRVPGVAGATLHTTNLQVFPKVSLQLADRVRLEPHTPLPRPAVFPSESRLLALMEHMFARNHRPPSVFDPRTPAPVEHPWRAAAVDPIPVPQVFAAPVPRVLKREFQAPPAPIREAPRASSAAVIESPPPSPGPRSAPAPIAAAEVNRLTNEVLRAIDRRVVAQRERRGKR